MNKIINFNKLITKHINEKEKEEAWGEGDGNEIYHPSSLGICKRQMLIRKANLSTPDRTLKGIFFIGKMFHEFVQSLVHNSVYHERKIWIEKPIEYEIPQSDGLKIKGHIDIYDGDDVVYDIKSYTSKYGITLKQVKPQHKVQVMMYMSAVNALKGSVLYIDKKTFNTKQFVFDYDVELVKTIYKKIISFHPIYMKWVKNGKDINNIPFKKCNCVYCKYEKLK